MFTAKDLKSLPKEKVLEALNELTPSQIEELQYTWEFWARPDQLEPKGNWKVWLPLAGRGWGKTRTGAEWVRHQVKKGLHRIACVAPTRGDVRRVMVEGESGLLNVCWKGDKTYRGADMGFPDWSPTNNTMTWKNGAVAQFFSAEDPERLRGPQFHSAWCDEICAWNNMEETWDMLQFTLRLGKNPRILVTTTPKPVKLLRRLMAPENVQSGRVYITRGSTYDNKDNIDIEALQQYEGTRLGRQELYAEVLDEAAGALWNRKMIDEAQYDLPEGTVVKAEDGSVDYDASRVAFAQTLARVVVSVDPAVSANEESDMTGIIVAGVDVNGTAYVIEDSTGQYLPEQWATKVQELYQKYQADLVVAERNQGGDMVKHTIRTVDELLPVKMVHASRGKFARAEPVSSLYERKKVKHLKYLSALEEQMVTWEPLGSIGSPDRLDAMVWAITNLLLKGYAQAPVKISYGALSGISF